jgi:hypothetical protein
MSNPAPLPSAWVDRLFSRFVAMYGSQKVGAMWADADRDEVKGVWADALGRYTGETIAAAVRGLIDSGSQWPPTLPEFSEACRVAAVNRRDQALALAAPGGTVTTREEAAEILAKIGYQAPAKPKVDPKAWAHRILARAAAGDQSLALESIRMAERAIKAKDAA